MLKNRIIEEIAKELIKANGNCKYDPDCLYGFGQKCAAPESLLEKKLNEFEKEEGSLSFIDYDLSADWPCDECQVTVINFVEPKRQKS